MPRSRGSYMQIWLILVLLLFFLYLLRMHHWPRRAYWSPPKRPDKPDEASGWDFSLDMKGNQLTIIHAAWRQRRWTRQGLKRGLLGDSCGGKNNEAESCKASCPWKTSRFSRNSSKSTIHHDAGAFSTGSGWPFLLAESQKFPFSLSGNYSIPLPESKRPSFRSQICGNPTKA